LATLLPTFATNEILNIYRNYIEIKNKCKHVPRFPKGRFFQARVRVNLGKFHTVNLQRVFPSQNRPVNRGFDLLNLTHRFREVNLRLASVNK